MRKSELRLQVNNMYPYCVCADIGDAMHFNIIKLSDDYSDLDECIELARGIAKVRGKGDVYVREDKTHRVGSFVVQEWGYAWREWLDE